jgi:hypothetical protein
VYTPSIEMRMKTLQFTILAALMSTSLVNAGTVVLSGDGNIGNAINGSDGASVVAGNSTFFSNLLGSGTNVVIEGPTAGAYTGDEYDAEAAIAAYYSGLGDTVVQVAAGSVTAATLDGANLFISDLNDTAFPTAETSAISTFLSGGGTALFEGEYSPYDVGADALINGALAAVGSSMSLVGNAEDCGFQVASGAQIGSTPLDAGISSFGYGCVSTITGGTAVFNTTLAGGALPFIAEETTASSTPEPSTVLLTLGGGFLLMIGRRRGLLTR